MDVLVEEWNGEREREWGKVRVRTSQLFAKRQRMTIICIGHYRFCWLPMCVTAAIIIINSYSIGQRSVRYLENSKAYLDEGRIE